MVIFSYLLISYLVGSLMAGYFVVRFLGRKDIRVEGSGNVGARNAGRVHGKLSFILTFLGDALKGVLVIILGEYLKLPPELTITGLGFAILGHVKPITLKFKGGMGISTFIGGMLAFEPLTALVIISGFLLLYPFLKSFTFAGLGSFVLIPVFFYFLAIHQLAILVSAILVMIIIFIHREDISERLDKKRKN
ncbi:MULTISPECIES: glycerol-3-phosphate acyltransferase [unclassified Bacillus (in: firmicutes)]|uniref:glycerol-3-phosphate acyltransferase n=1 Tax=unclassified Bacillus (in: firmicutes) TaxID=185979 RepID=UPI001BECB6BE|nr:MULTISPECIES: glycerol-3-phosphate acyltransferase [unclassified Bacillus (in: firmicutes)]MBT2638252.1 glycerol-3-phosphate acyltransferase [Bacillus sp. ISL-39]MBT2661391.1 glycerol-3-phosphate acyltransferase [Bacillus sp. ISL-45]